MQERLSRHQAVWNEAGVDFWNKTYGALNTRKASCGAQKQNSVLALKPLPPRSPASYSFWKGR